MEVKKIVVGELTMQQKSSELKTKYHFVKKKVVRRLSFEVSDERILKRH